MFLSLHIKMNCFMLFHYGVFLSILVTYRGDINNDMDLLANQFEMIAEQNYYIDKTKLIEEVISLCWTPEPFGKVMVLATPPCFCKSVIL